MAQRIPTRAIREDACTSLGSKREHTDGAALFTILPSLRNSHLLSLLVSYELIWDFLDNVNERAADRGQQNGRQLHLALIDALKPSGPLADYYHYHPWHDDGGYLASLVNACRDAACNLPSFDVIRPWVLREARLAQVLAINHDPNPVDRDTGLRRWAEREFPGSHEAIWFELSGAASASLTVHALFALACQPKLTQKEIEQTRAAYRWISAATTMLDSYVDQIEDAANGDHSYVSHYLTTEVATRRIGELLRRSMEEAARLPHRERHILIASMMTAMYLSKDSARSRQLHRGSREILKAGGILPRLLRPVLRLWRIAYSLRS